MIIILDSSTITLLVVQSKPQHEAYLCKQWLFLMLARGAYVVAPDICIYEVLRGIYYQARKKGRQVDTKLRNLENLKKYLNYLPLSELVLYRAALLWSEAMLSGQIRPKGVDVDMLVLAHLQIERENNPGRQVIVATRNLKDFQLFSKEDAAEWYDIKI